MATPSIAQIKSLLESQVGSYLAQTSQSQNAASGDLEQLFSNDINFEIAGHGFGLASNIKGIAALKDFTTASSTPSLASIIDMSKPVHGEVVRVIGGEGPWAAAVLKSTATTKIGNPWNHEMIITLRFDNGKISEMKWYLDTLQVQNHILENTQ